MTGVAEAFQGAREEFREFAKIARTVEGILAAHTRAILFGFSDHIDRIESRTKDFVSIRDNYIDAYGLPTPGISLNEFLRDANDLVGVRVVVFYNSDVDAIRDVLIEVYPEAKLEEKLTVHDVNKGARFGYRAAHVNFMFSDDLILRSQSRSEIGVEIQIRTILSDAWARHSHKLAYKSKPLPTDEMLRSFALTAAMLENVDGQIETIRSLPLVPERKEVDEELSWMESYGAINKVLGTLVDEEAVKSLYVTLGDRGKSLGSTDFADEFVTDASRAWAAFRNVDFTRYGIRDPLTQLKMALYGLDREKYEGLVPLHMREKIDNILQVGSRKAW